MSDLPHPEVRHHPETGHVAINLGKIVTGGGHHWLLVQLDERGDVIATGMHHHEVEDWPELRHYNLDEGDE